MKLIDKDAVVADIEKRYVYWDGVMRSSAATEAVARKNQCKEFLSFINTLEAKEVGFWHKQSEEDIDDSFNDWSLHRFVCLMKDGSIQEFTGMLDECYDGSINLHLDCVNDEYDWEYDDIIFWIEVPNIKAQKGEDV